MAQAPCPWETYTLRVLAAQQSWWIASRTCSAGAVPRCSGGMEVGLGPGGSPVTACHCCMGWCGGSTNLEAAGQSATAAATADWAAVACTSAARHCCMCVAGQHVAGSGRPIGCRRCHSPSIAAAARVWGCVMSWNAPRPPWAGPPMQGWLGRH